VDKCKLPSDTYVDVSPITRTNSFIRISKVVLLFQKQRGTAAILLKQEKFDPIVPSYAVSRGALKQKRWGCLRASTMYRLKV
jgi:hypothetical protein